MDKKKRQTDSRPGKGIVWLIQMPYRLLHYFLSGHVPEFENARQEERFWRIKRQYRRKRLFLLNLLAYISVIVVSIALVIHDYLYISRLSKNPTLTIDRLWVNFNELLLSVGAGVLIWTLILFVHFFFNRMSNDEDHAIGEAFEHDYARPEREEIDYSRRLVEPNYNEESDFEDEVKQNHGVHS